MKTLFIQLILVAFIGGLLIPEVYAKTNAGSSVTEMQDKKKKEKKEKEAFDWEKVRPDKLSGDKDMDLYILTCDTMWTRIQSYKDSINFFTLDTVWATNNDGTLCKVVKIQDQDGTPRNFSESLKQGMDIVFTGTSIVLDAASITLLNTTAGLSLASNPLLAFKYGKCLKGGLNINKLAYNEVKEIVNATKKQMAETKSMRQSQMEGSTDQAIILPQEEGEQPNQDEIKKLSEIDLGNSDNEIDISELEDFDLSEIEIPETGKDK